MVKLFYFYFCHEMCTVSAVSKRKFVLLRECNVFIVMLPLLSQPILTKNWNVNNIVICWLY